MTTSAAAAVGSGVAAGSGVAVSVAVAVGSATAVAVCVGAWGVGGAGVASGTGVEVGRTAASSTSFPRQALNARARSKRRNEAVPTPKEAKEGRFRSASTLPTLRGRRYGGTSFSLEVMSGPLSQAAPSSPRLQSVLRQHPREYGQCPASDDSGGCSSSPRWRRTAGTSYVVARPPDE